MASENPKQPSPADKEFERKVLAAIEEIKLVLEKYELGLIPQLQYSANGIEPIFKYYPQPPAPKIITAPQGILAPTHLSAATKQ